MRILYADSGLRGLEGHVASSGIALPPAFRRLGHEVIVLGHRDMVPALQAATGAVPFFRAYTWGASSPDPYIGWLIDFGHDLDATLADLHRAWVEFGPFDLVYINTARAVQLAAVGRWLKEAFPILGPAPAVAVQLGPDPGLVRAGPPDAPTFTIRDPTTVLHRYAAHLLGSEMTGRLNLLAVNDTVAEEYSVIVDSPVRGITTPEALPVSRRRSPSGPLVVGFLGYQRIDKGYDLLPELVQELLRRQGRLRCLVQHSDPEGVDQDHPDRNLRSTRRLLEIAEREQRLEMVLRPVVGNAWFELIDRCDIVALPYDPVRYASSYSAIFGEALASGAPIVAPGGTTMANEMERAGGIGVPFSNWAVPSIASAIDLAVERFEDLSERAFRAGLEWQRHHGPDAYVAQVIGAAGLDGAGGTARLTPAQVRRSNQRMPIGFFCNPQLHNGAAVRSSEDTDGSLPSRLDGRSVARSPRAFLRRRQPTEVMNVVIETSTAPWNYALIFDVNAEIMRKVPPSSVITVEAIIEVTGGAIGIGWIDPDHQLSSAEQIATARYGVQHLAVSVSSEQAHRLMLRNVDANGRRAVFTLKSLSAVANVSWTPKLVV